MKKWTCLARHPTQSDATKNNTAKTTLGFIAFVVLGKKYNENCNRYILSCSCTLDRTINTFKQNTTPNSHANSD